MMLRTLVAALIAALPIAQGYAQQAGGPPPGPPDFSKVEITTTDLGHKTYMLAGQGGNMTVAVGSDAVLLVDTEFAPLHDKIKAAITAVSTNPVKYAVITHFHGDHSGGVALMAKDGTVVVSQENVRKRLAAGTSNVLTGAKVEPQTGDALPAKTYTDKLTLDFGKREAVVHYLPMAHTDGDSYVYFADANVLNTGDVVVSTNGRYPNIDVGNGGSIKGILAAVDTLLKVANKDTKIVPGHGPLLTRAALVDYRAFLQKANDHVAAQIAAGKSEDEAVAAKPLADLEAASGTNEQASANFVKLVYRSLKSNK